jgi:hypothetical protein
MGSYFWWTDSLTFSYFKKEPLALFASIGICWLGICYLAVLVVRATFNIINEKFIGPIDLAFNEYYYKDIGYTNAKKFKIRFTLIACSLLIFTLIIYYLGVKYYGENQLEKFGQTQMVKVLEIRKDIKKNEYIHFAYGHGQTTNLLNKDYRVGDSISIRYARSNPKIIEYTDESASANIGYYNCCMCKPKRYCSINIYNLQRRLRSPRRN